MSFTKYLENKARPKILINIDEYKENIQADMSSLLLKPNDSINEARKNIVNLSEVSRILSQISYPRAEEFKMAIRTGDPKKVGHSHSVFRKWTEYNKIENHLSDKIETILFNYQSKLYHKEFLSEDVDKSVQSAISESMNILNKMAHSIDLAISNIPNWGNHKINIKAMLPRENWIVEKAKVFIGEQLVYSFELENQPISLKIHLQENNAKIPENMMQNIQDLLGKLQSNPKYNRVLTLYMNRPISERRYYEMLKRDLSLGIEMSLPSHIVLSNTILDSDNDVWKVKLEERHLFEFLNEGTFKEYHIIRDEAPIKWIERINNEK